MEKNEEIRAIHAAQAQEGQTSSTGASDDVGEDVCERMVGGVGGWCGVGERMWGWVGEVAILLKDCCVTDQHFCLLRPRPFGPPPPSPSPPLPLRHKPTPFPAIRSL